MSYLLILKTIYPFPDDNDKIYRIIYELQRITVFELRVRRFANDFRHEWKSLENHITSDPKIVIHCNECIILFLIHYFMSWIYNWLKYLTIAGFAIVAKDGLLCLSIVTSSQLICDVMGTWGTDIVMSYLPIVLTHTNWCKGNLHKWIRTVNIDFSPPGIHGLASKKYIFYDAIGGLPMCVLSYIFAWHRGSSGQRPWVRLLHSLVHCHLARLCEDLFSAAIRDRERSSRG